MQKIIERTIAAVPIFYPAYAHHDPYTLLDTYPEVIVGAAKHANGGHLPCTSRARGRARQQFKKSRWKLAKYFTTRTSGQLYSVIIELGNLTLFRKDTEKLVRELVSKVDRWGGKYFYSAEKAIGGKAHVHMLVHLPKTRRIPQKIKDDSGTPYVLKHIIFNTDYPGRSLLEGVTRFIRYLGKPRDARHLSNGDQKAAAFLDEFHEYLLCEWERTVLSGSNINTRYIGTEDKKKFLDYYDELFDKRPISSSTDVRVTPAAEVDAVTALIWVSIQASQTGSNPVLDDNQLSKGEKKSGGVRLHPPAYHSSLAAIRGVPTPATSTLRRAQSK